MSKKKGGPGMQSFLEETLSPTVGMFKRVTSQVSSSDSSKPDTLEVLPTLDHYTDSSTDASYRPTLQELHDQKTKGGKRIEERTKSRKQDAGLKFGWIQGVLVRCLLNIFGVMLFIRLSWVTGQAGIGLASVIILLSMVVTILSTLSMSAICTNGEVEGGGAYYMISRSLGPEFGGAIGIIFSLANAVAAAMYIVGFAETVVDLMEETDVTITGNTLHDIRIIGCGTAVLLLGIVLIGMEWEAKAQLILLVILLAAIVNFIVGTFIPPTPEKVEQGFVGYRTEVFLKNFGPDFRLGEDFFSIFSVFFPAATGILAGANISGDLKDPQKAIPKGTLLAIVLTGVVYILMGWLCGAVLLRDAFGPIFVNQTLNYTISTVSSQVLLNDSTEGYPVPACRADDSCKYGLENNYGAVGLASGFRPLILAGIFSATLSSALASLVGAPKVFQAVCKDKLFPGIFFFAKGYGKSGEPFRGYALAFVIALAVTCIADLNVIAPIISNFFLMAYTLINFSCFDASIAMSPGWRPSFKYYNKWLSLLGAVLCLAVMFIINWWAALITFSIVAILYTYVHRRKLGVNWGSSLQAHTYQDALKNALKLNHTEEHVKNFRPQILVMSGEPQYRPDLVLFASEITKKQSLLICANVIQGRQEDSLDLLKSTASEDWLDKHKIKGFYCPLTAPNYRIGAQILQQVGGLGKLKPNILLLGYKSDWLQADKTDVQNYCYMIDDSFMVENSVGVFRMSEGFGRRDSGEVSNGSFHSLDDITVKESAGGVDNPAFSGEEDPELSKSGKKAKSEKVVALSLTPIDKDKQPAESGLPKSQSQDTIIELDDEGSPEFGKNFKPTGTIDVWWLFDDGGLTLLLPFILSERGYMKHCSLRIFCVGSRLTRNKDYQRMTTLLSKFRIEYSSLTLLTDIGKVPDKDSIDWFEELITDWRTPENEEVVTNKRLTISKEEMKDFEKQTHRKIRLRELLLDHTTPDTNLIVMTLPMPQSSMSTGLYMAWMETLTRDMPPFLLLRGNQQNVLTFYS